MSVRDPKAWMPKDMLDADKDYFAHLAPTDAHMAAALAWEAWSSTLDAEPVVQTVSTGAQSATYAKGYSPHQNAQERAAWHRSRAKIKSVAVGPHFVDTPSYTPLTREEQEDFDGIVEHEDGTRHRVIHTEQITPWYEEKV
jgi:hypothetical protein